MTSRSAMGPTVLFLLTLGLPHVAAQETPSDTLLTVGHYLDFERVSDPQISPDGSQIVYTRAQVDKMNDRFESGVWIMGADGSRHRFLVDGSSPRWSPDGTRIAYLAEGEPEGAQLFVRWMDAEGAISQITRETETPSNFRWGPEGRYIYFQRIVRGAESWSIDLPSAPAGAQWTPAPRIVDRMHYRFDGIGFLPDGWNHLFRVPADGGTAMQLTKGDSTSVAPSFPASEAPGTTSPPTAARSSSTASLRIPTYPTSSPTSGRSTSLLARSASSPSAAAPGRAP